MHILFITSSYKSRFNPNSAPFFRDQAKALNDHGLKIGIICPLPISIKTIWKKKLFRFPSEIYFDGEILTMVDPFPSLPKMANRSRKIRLTKGKQLFKKYLSKNGKPDVIHVHSFLAGEIALWIKDKYGIPFVITEHSSGFERNLYSQNQLDLAYEVFTNSNANLCVSNSLLKSIIKYFKGLSFKVVPNIVDVDFFTLKKETPNKVYQFINVAHLKRNKSQLELINAFSQGFKNNNIFKLIIVGAGPEKQNLQNRIDNLKMDEQIKLFGAAKREEVKKLMQESNCFVLSSKVETFGVVIIEAMACGLPVLSTKCGGPEAIIVNNDLGILSEIEDFPESMKKISSKTFSSEKIRDYVKDNFSGISLVEKLKSIYFKCLTSEKK